MTAYPPIRHAVGEGRLMISTDMFHLTDRIAVVTGAGRGIGRAMALALAGAGADVVAVGRHPT